MGDRIIR